MRSIETAASIVYDSDPIQGMGAPFPYPDFFAFFLQLVQTLVQCKPTPAQGLDYLSWRPWRAFDWFGHRLSAYRANIEVLMANGWKGDVKGFRAFADSVWQAVDAGRLTPTLITGMYADAKGG